MRTLFDTSVLVATLVDQLANHEAAFGAFVRYTSDGHVGYCSAHTLAEAYATLTALPIAKRISPEEARVLVEETLIGRLTVVPLALNDYQSVLRQVAALGLSSGAIYDALHAHCALKEGVDQILTYNFSDFTRFPLQGVTLALP